MTVKQKSQSNSYQRRDKDSAKPRCQCDPGCKKTPLKGSPFCKIHKRYCPVKAPLSGYETLYNPTRYNKKKGIKESHNCFAYAFDYIKMPHNCTEDNCDASFPQPGRTSGYPKWSKIKGKRCPDLVARLFGDVRGLLPSKFVHRCPKGTRKIATVTDENQDYHFYRQDSNGYWSHKPGATDVTNIDATGRLIYNPQLASRLYPGSGLNYKNFCGYMCTPHTRTLRLRRGGSGSHKRSHKRSSSRSRTKK